MRSGRWWDRTKRRTRFQRGRLSGSRTKREQGEWARTLRATRHRNRANHGPLRVVKPGFLALASQRPAAFPMRSLRKLVHRRRYSPAPAGKGTASR